MFIPFIVMGLTSMLLQITVLRLLLSTFSGNELDIGITLSFWLIYVGLGSYAGRKILFRNALAASFLFVALLALPTALAIKSIMPALSLEPGETVSFASVVFSTAVTLFPLCFFIGLQFPLAVLHRSGYVPVPAAGNIAGNVYGLEAMGAFFGGILFTFIISSRIDAFELCLLISLIDILVASYLIKKKSIALFFIIPLTFYFAFHKLAVTLPWQASEVSRAVESKYGEITVIKVSGQSSIYENGHLLFSYPDIQTEEMTAHLPMTLHPSSSRILVIGGSPGILKELLMYQVGRIDFIELDPKIIQVSFDLLSSEDREAVKDQRVNIIIDDGRRFIKKVDKQKFDMIVLNLPPPSTAGINRFYTIDFFREAKSVLKEDGIITLHIPQSAGYIGRRMQTASGSVYHSLKSVFRYVEVTAQEYGDIFASDSPIQSDPDTLEDRFVRMGIHTAYFHQYIFRDAFSPLNTEYVRQKLGEIHLTNTDLHPSAYLYNLMLWTEMHGGKMLSYLLAFKKQHFIGILSVVFLLASLIIFKRKSRVISCSIFTTGFSGMSFVLVVLLTYQALFGYVYEMIGILSAFFMIGLWTGTLFIKNQQNPLRILFYLELMTAAFAIVSPLFFTSEFLFYSLIFLSGAITGSQFSAANMATGDIKAAGKLYSLDLAGSFLGAFIPAIIIIPLFGIYNALYLIAAIKAFSAIMIGSLFLPFQGRVKRDGMT